MEMNRSRRVILSLLVGAILLFLGLLFWPFLVSNIIKPAALVIWLLLRILVLSIQQKYFWYAVILAAFFVLFRLLYQAQSELPSASSLETNTTMINISYWRGLFMYNGQAAKEDKILKRQLTSLLTSLYALKQGKSNDFRIHDALQQARIPLPENIHAFLFAQEPPLSGGSLTKFFQSLRRIAQKWIHRWTGREKAEYYQRIDEVLNFIETSLELNNDERKLSQDKH